MSALSTTSASVMDTITPFSAPTKGKLDTENWFNASHVPTVQSPVDEFRANLAQINVLYLQAHGRGEYTPILGSLVYLGMVSAAEGYFRSLLRRLILVDEACQHNASSRTLTYGAAMTMFTYLRPFLERVTGVDVTTLSVLLLILGSAGFIGTWAAGRMVGNGVAALLSLPAIVMGGCTLALLAAGPSLVATAAILAVWGAMNTATSVIWMGWMSQNVEDAPEAAGSLMVAAIQASILLGAVLGGLLLDGISIRATFLGSAVLAALAVLVAGNGKRLLNPATQVGFHSSAKGRYHEDHANDPEPQNPARDRAGQPDRAAPTSQGQ